MKIETNTNFAKCEIKLKEGKSFLRTFWLENKEDTMKQKWIVFYADGSIRSIMALPVMEFQDQGYKIRKVFEEK